MPQILTSHFLLCNCLKCGKFEHTPNTLITLKELLPKWLVLGSSKCWGQEAKACDFKKTAVLMACHTAVSLNLNQNLTLIIYGHHSRDIFVPLQTLCPQSLFYVAILVSLCIFL